MNEESTAETTEIRETETSFKDRITEILAKLGIIKKKILVSSDGGLKQEKTVEEADTQAQVELKKAEAKAPPGAQVELVDRGGGTQEVVTNIPDEPVSKKEKPETE